MGYTHRWSFSRQLTHGEYNAIRDAARQIVGRCEIPLADGSGTPGSTPALISPVVSFNGVGDDRCEEFAIWRIQPIRHYDPEDGVFFDFCKTERKPYDAAVTAVLLAAKRELKGVIHLASDGVVEEWLNGPDDGVPGGAAIYRHVFGEDPIPLMAELDTYEARRQRALGQLPSGDQAKEVPDDN